MEDIVDGAADVTTERNNLAVHAMQDTLEHVALAWVLTVKQLEQLRVRNGANMQTRFENVVSMYSLPTFGWNSLCSRNAENSS